tara:strand:+ start:8423 stop:8677 length:255 start_codon:yes stop_codon:yes gene_type:complete
MGIKVSVNNDSNVKVRVGQQTGVKVPTTSSGASGGTVAALGDTDVTSLQNGAVLVYDATTSNWVATLELTPTNTKNLDVNGGSF